MAVQNEAGAWVRHSAYLARKIKSGMAPDAASQEVRRELDWLPFRYVGIDGRTYTDLPAGYVWRDAKIDLDDFVVWPEEELGPPVIGPLAHIAEEVRGIQRAADVATGRALPLRRRLNVYQLEVFVPVTKPETSPFESAETVQPGMFAEPRESQSDDLPVRGPMEPMRWLEERLKQRKSSETPATFAKRIAPTMVEAHKRGEVKKAWAERYIANIISKDRPGLWPKS